MTEHIGSQVWQTWNGAESRSLQTEQKVEVYTVALTSAILQVNLCLRAPSIKELDDFVAAKIYCSHALAVGNYSIEITVCTVVQDCCKGRSNKYRKWHLWGSFRPETP